MISALREPSPSEEKSSKQVKYTYMCVYKITGRNANAVNASTRVLGSGIRWSGRLPEEVTFELRPDG